MEPLPDISIRQLEYLVAVAEARTFAAAADRVGVSASALSQGLAELERRVGVELFEPAGRRRVIRAGASPVLEHARQVVALTRDLVDWSGRLQAASSGRVRLGMIDVAAVVHFPEILRRFRTERPQVDLALTVAPSKSLLDDLRAGRADLVVCVRPPADVPGIRLTSLLAEPLLVFAPAGTELGPPSGWGPWVLFPEGSHTRAATVERLRSLGAPVHVAAVSHQPDVLLEMVGLGLGWTVLPTPHGQARLDHVRRGKEILRREIVLARRAGSVHDPAVDELGRLLDDHARTALSDRVPNADSSA